MDNTNQTLHDVKKGNQKNNAGKVVTSTHKDDTLAYAIDVFNVHFKGRGIPLPPDEPRQVEHWNEQIIGKIIKTRRTIKYMTHDGVVCESSTVNNMKNQGTTEEQKQINKIIGNRRRSESSKGREQMHPVESTAIACFLRLCSIMIPEVFSEWEFGPVFDGLQADLMVRNKSWTNNTWVAIQTKSSRITMGKKTTYFKKTEIQCRWHLLHGNRYA